MFHEFGHALHGLFSNVKYPLLVGHERAAGLRRVPVAVQRDVGARARRCSRTIAKHYKTGEAMPKALLDKVLAAQKFGAGLRDARVPRGRDARPGVAPGRRRRSCRRPTDVMAFEAERAREGRHRVRAGAAALPHAVLPAHLRGRLRGRLLRVHLERGARARLRRVVPHARRAHRANGDTFRAKILSRGRTKEPSVLFQEFYGKRARDRAAARVPRPQEVVRHWVHAASGVSC